MKNIYLIITLLFSSMMFGQPTNFNNGGGDFIWSNPSNWTAGVPTSTSIVQLPLTVTSQVNADYTIQLIRPLTSTAGDVAVAGQGNLTIVGYANNSQYVIDNNSSNNIKLSFKGNVTVDNSAGSSSFSRIRNFNGSSNSLEFEDGSTLTLIAGLDIYPGSSTNINFNGSLAGNGNIRFQANSAATFGSTSSNSGYTGQLVFLANSSVIVNATDNNIFYDGPKIQVNGNGASIELNGANVFDSGITVGGTNAFSFNANKNQDNMTNIIFQGAGTLNMVIDPNVTQLFFADNSVSDWNTGTLNITNFTEGVIRFGTDSNGLTSSQLSQINIVGGTGPVALNSTGYLFYQSSLSTKDFDQKADKRISYPTLATYKLMFSKPQQDVKIFDISGKMILQNKSENLSEITLGTLSKGLYLIVFDNQKVEKFIKQ